jgi:hypothetical protein
MMHQYTRYWLTTVPASEGVDAHEAGQIIDFGQTGPEGMMWFEGHGPSEGYGTIEGKYSDIKFRVDVKTGVPYAWEPPPEPVTAERVKAEAERRILARYPLTKQIDTLIEGGAPLAEMRLFIDAVRAASNRLDRKKTIPRDFASDHQWPK